MIGSMPLQPMKHKKLNLVKGAASGAALGGLGGAAVGLPEAGIGAAVTAPIGAAVGAVAGVSGAHKQNVAKVYGPPKKPRSLTSTVQHTRRITH